jgi:hypothetical protein
MIIYYNIIQFGPETYFVAEFQEGLPVSILINTCVQIYVQNRWC